MFRRTNSHGFCDCSPCVRTCRWAQLATVLLPTQPKNHHRQNQPMARFSATENAANNYPFRWRGCSRLLKKPLGTLLEGAPHDVDVSSLVDCLEQRFHPVRMHQVHVWQVAPGQGALTAHLAVPNMGVIQASALYQDMRLFSKRNGTSSMSHCNRRRRVVEGKRCLGSGPKLMVTGTKLQTREGTVGQAPSQCQHRAGISWVSQRKNSALAPPRGVYSLGRLKAEIQVKTTFRLWGADRSCRRQPETRTCKGTGT